MTAKGQHFQCTMCGKCCFGSIPLTLADAFAHIGTFPLAMVWTPVRSSSRAYDITAKLGTVFELSKKQKIAVLLAPTAYIPSAMACPALLPANMCGIQSSKPQRCKTMPFYPYWDEADQAELLVPRKDWACDVSEEAPLVYQNKKIVDCTDFVRERAELIDDAKALKAYADQKLSQAGPQRAGLLQAAQNPVAGRFVENFSSFIRYDRRMDLVEFAQRQQPVLAAFTKKTTAANNLKIYHDYYQKTAEELDWFVRRAQRGA